MNIEIKDTLTLTDNIEYTVVSKINFQDEIHYLLVGVTTDANREPKHFKHLEDGNLMEITDKEVKERLFPLFFQEAMKHVTEDEMKIVAEMLSGSEQDTN